MEKIFSLKLNLFSNEVKQKTHRRIIRRIMYLRSLRSSSWLSFFSQATILVEDCTVLSELTLWVPYGFVYQNVQHLELVSPSSAVLLYKCNLVVSVFVSLSSVVLLRKFNLVVSIFFMKRLNFAPAYLSHLYQRFPLYLIHCNFFWVLCSECIADTCP